MVDAWPNDLPQCFPMDGYQEGMADNLLYSQTDVGPAKVRRRSSAAPRPLSLSLIITRTQLAVLRAFIDETLAGGSLPFNIPAQTEPGEWLVRFVSGGLPTWERVGPKFSIKMKLEILH